MNEIFLLSKLITRPTDNWIHSDFVSFFTVLRLPTKYADYFQQHKIEGCTLSNLKHESNLYDVGIENKLHRRKVWVWLTDDRFLKSFDKLISRTQESEASKFKRLMDDPSNQDPFTFLIEGNQRSSNLKEFVGQLEQSIKVRKLQNPNLKMRVVIKNKKFNQSVSTDSKFRSSSKKRSFPWKIVYGNEKFDVQKELSVGSGKKNTILIDHCDCETTHCLFVIENDDCKIIDKSDQAGTYISKKSIEFTSNQAISFCIEDEYFVEVTEVQYRQEEETAQFKVCIQDYNKNFILPEFTIDLDKQEVSKYTFGGPSKNDSAHTEITHFKHGFAITFSQHGGLVVIPSYGLEVLMQKLPRGSTECLEHNQEIFIGSHENKLRILFDQTE